MALTAFLIFSSGFNTQPRGGGCAALAAFLLSAVVSTHSRAEAAATNEGEFKINGCGFNTQPRGGGCYLYDYA